MTLAPNPDHPQSTNSIIPLRSTNPSPLALNLRRVCCFQGNRRHAFAWPTPSCQDPSKRYRGVHLPQNLPRTATPAIRSRIPAYSCVEIFSSHLGILESPILHVSPPPRPACCRCASQHPKTKPCIPLSSLRSRNLRFLHNVGHSDDCSVGLRDLNPCCSQWIVKFSEILPVHCNSVADGILPSPL